MSNKTEQSKTDPACITALAGVLIDITRRFVKDGIMVDGKIVAQPLPKRRRNQAA